MLNSYKELNVWRKGIELVTEIYALTEQFPKSEIYGLSNQIRRSAISIPSNIAEGYNRKHKQEYIQFLRIAYGSGGELETQLIIANNLKFINPRDFDRIDKLLTEIMKMLNKLISTLVAKP